MISRFKSTYNDIVCSPLNNLCVIKNIDDLANTVNNELMLLSDWYKANKLSLDVCKTNCIILLETKEWVIMNEYSLFPPFAEDLKKEWVISNLK